ncbi:MAG: hypothetical protein WCI55_12660 [Armatimonadota bacterium]
MTFVIGLIVMVMYLGLLHARYEGQTYAPKIIELKIVVAIMTLLISWPFIGTFYIIRPASFGEYLWNVGSSTAVLYLASTLLRKIVGLKVLRIEITLITAGVFLALTAQLLLPAYY